jgi:hypothetical protein
VPHENVTSSQNLVAFSGTKIQPALALVVARALIATRANRAVVVNFDFIVIGLSMCVGETRLARSASSTMPDRNRFEA